MCESKAGTNSAEFGMQVGAGVPELGGERQFSPGTNAWTYSGVVGLEGLIPCDIGPYWLWDRGP